MEGNNSILYLKNIYVSNIYGGTLVETGGLCLLRISYDCRMAHVAHCLVRNDIGAWLPIQSYHLSICSQFHGCFDFNPFLLDFCLTIRPLTEACVGECFVPLFVNLGPVVQN